MLDFFGTWFLWRHPRLATDSCFIIPSAEGLVPQTELLLFTPVFATILRLTAPQAVRAHPLNFSLPRTRRLNFKEVQLCERAYQRLHVSLLYHTICSTFFNNDALHEVILQKPHPGLPMWMKRYSLSVTSTPFHDAPVEFVYEHSDPSPSGQLFPISSRRQNKVVGRGHVDAGGLHVPSVSFLEDTSGNTLSHTGDLHPSEQEDVAWSTNDPGQQMGKFEKKTIPQRLTLVSDGDGKRVSSLTHVEQGDRFAGVAENKKQSVDLPGNPSRREGPFAQSPLEEEDVVVDSVNETEQKISSQATVNPVGAKRLNFQPLLEEEDVIVDDIRETEPQKLDQLVMSSVKMETPFSRSSLEEADVIVHKIHEAGHPKSGHPVVDSVAAKASVGRLLVEEEDVIVDDIDEAQRKNLTKPMLNSALPETRFSAPPLAEEDVIVDNIVESEQLNLGTPENLTAAERREFATPHFLRGEKDITQSHAQRNTSMGKPFQRRRFDNKLTGSFKTLGKVSRPYANWVSGPLSSFLQKASGVARGGYFLSGASNSGAERDGPVFMEDPTPNSIPTVVVNDMPAVTDSAKMLPSSVAPVSKSLKDETTGTNHDGASEVVKATSRGQLEMPTLQQEERYAPVKYAPSLTFDSEGNGPYFQTEASIGGTQVSVDEERIHQFQNNYQEWVYVILESMYGTDWDSENPAIRETRECSEKRLKNRGCALLVPACKKYTTRPGGWSCEMSLWRACSCSVPYKSFLRYLIPPASECYGELLHPSDVLRLMDTHFNFDPLVDTSSQVLIPAGYCGWSGFFVFYIIMVAILIIAFIGVLSRLARRALKGKPFASLARAKRGERISTAVTMSEGSPTSFVTTSETQPLLTNRYAARRMPV